MAYMVSRKTRLSWALFALVLGLLIPIKVAGKSVEIQKITETKTEFSGLVFSWTEQRDSHPFLQVRLWRKGAQSARSTWGPWYDVEDDPDRDEYEATESKKPEVLFLTNESRRFEYRTNLPDVTVTPLSYGKKLPVPSGMFASLDIPDSIQIVKREAWGADEELLFESQVTASANGNGDFEDIDAPTHEEADPEIERVVKTNGFGRPYRWPLQYMKDVKFVVVHHTASEKNLENPIQALQNLYYYHSVKRGWGDIGYHYVIDTQGNVYEGRQGGKKVIGGHARNLNKVSVGIAVMGNYENGEIPVPVMRSLLSLVNSLTKLHNLDPDGFTGYKEKTYRNVNGHKDSNATICPGRFLYQKLYGVRELIAHDQLLASSSIYEDSDKRDVLVIQPQKEQALTVRLKNISTESWPAGTSLQATPDIVGFDDLSFESSPDNVLSIMRLQNGPVQSGSTGTFEGKVTTTLQSGLSVIKLRLTLPGQTPDTRKIPLPIFVEGLNAEYEIVERRDPAAILSPGQTINGFLKLRNKGNFTWKKQGAGMAKIAAKDLSVIAELQEDSVTPGSIGTFRYTAKAPEQNGIKKTFFVLSGENLKFTGDQGDFWQWNVSFPADLPKKLSSIRVKLGFSRAPLVRGYTFTNLREGSKLIKTFPKNSVFHIQPLEDNKFRVTVQSETFTLNEPVRLEPKFRNRLTVINWKRTPAWNPKINDNQFRGTLEIRNVDGTLTLINELLVEDYLKGLAEVSNDTPPEKIKTIVTLARTYAVFYMTKAQKFPGKPYHLDDDPQHTQKYLGYGFEKRAPNLAKAVKETGKQVVIYHGKLVKTPYFSQSDGRTRSAQEVWGWTDTPYLQSVPDPDCEGPLRGHGVGLSGCGADAMARGGKTAEEIIKYYYLGVEIVRGIW